MDDRIRELEQALDDARHELAHVRFDLEATRREKQEVELWRWAVAENGGMENIAGAIFILKNKPLAWMWLSDPFPEVCLSINGRTFLLRKTEIQ